eukprot:13771560-Ditylum_brightwellii.AAC.1
MMQRETLHLKDRNITNEKLLREEQERAKLLESRVQHYQSQQEDADEYQSGGTSCSSTTPESSNFSGVLAIQTPVGDWHQRSTLQEQGRQTPVGIKNWQAHRGNGPAHRKNSEGKGNWQTHRGNGLVPRKV